MMATILKKKTDLKKTDSNNKNIELFHMSFYKMDFTEVLIYE